MSIHYNITEFIQNKAPVFQLCVSYPVLSVTLDYKLLSKVGVIPWMYRHVYHTHTLRNL